MEANVLAGITMNMLEYRALTMVLLSKWATNFN